MKLKQYQVDAFASKVFEGNPAAVCPLDAWLDDALLQAIAQENNLSETAFLVRTPHGFQLRWFTPTIEVDLCGHATLASAHVVFQHMSTEQREIRFDTRSGPLFVTQTESGLQMDFPAKPPTRCTTWPESLTLALGITPTEVWLADDYIVVSDDEATIGAIHPDWHLLHQVPARGVVVTAPGTDVDFVSRFFAPRLGINEDPVTGSTHCELTPYWAQRTGKSLLQARQISQRGGAMQCELHGSRVRLTGKAVTFMEAVLSL